MRLALASLLLAPQFERLTPFRQIGGRTNIHFEGDDGAGNGNPGGGTTTGAGLPDQPAILTPEAFGGLRSLVTREGGLPRTAEVLYNENRDFRERNRVLDAEVTNLRTRTGEQERQLAAGTSGKPEDLADLTAYRALGKPDELKTKLSAHDDLVRFKSGIENGGKLKAAAKAEGYDPEKVAEIYSVDGLSFVVEKVDDGNGGQVDAGFQIRSKGEGQEPEKTRLGEAIAARFPSLSDGLKLTAPADRSRQQAGRGASMPGTQAAAPRTSGGKSRLDGAAARQNSRYTAPKRAGGGKKAD